ncbi:MAG: class I SAM-dependent methyltransferase [Alphaproteobacteria bacterium]|nr:class I SAM-dependent methyltransferase [Alphaproteobacteria bacterium]
MDDFFTARVDGYDEHMKSEIEGSSLFYKYTASLLPTEKNANVLDLGCGTGLELEEYFSVNPQAKVTGIDMTESMLDLLKKKFPDKDITTICGSYFDVPLGKELFDAAVSVESLHHFTKEEKIPLYVKLKEALKPGGFFILTDYFADREEQETFYRQELIRIRKEQNLPDDVFYHYDTPLTVEHEKEALLTAGFTRVDEVNRWESTHTLKAFK